MRYLMLLGIMVWAGCGDSGYVVQQQQTRQPQLWCAYGNYVYPGRRFYFGEVCWYQ